MRIGKTVVISMGAALVVFSTLAVGQSAANSSSKPVRQLGPDYGPPSPLPLDAGEKFAYSLKHNLLSPGTIIGSAAPAAAAYASPPKRYPTEWRDGAGGFGRNFGDYLSRNVVEVETASIAGMLFREDPRYYRSQNRFVPFRFVHAFGSVFITHGDSGRLHPAFGNFAGSAAAGFVGNAFLPDGYTDPTHAGQRSLEALTNVALNNVINEFTPEFMRFGKTIRRPFRKGHKH